MIVLDKHRKHNPGGQLNIKAITKEIRDKYPSLSSRTDWAINDKIHRLLDGNDPDGKTWNVWSEQEVDESGGQLKGHARRVAHRHARVAVQHEEFIVRKPRSLKSAKLNPSRVSADS